MTIIRIRTFFSFFSFLFSYHFIISFLLVPLFLSRSFFLFHFDSQQSFGFEINLHQFQKL